ncbi:sulfotransferase family protein [Chachezhania sediminis]|uniref:sulfotransferase family protein n=1 Tax=Chachezhania sediminis TaxID=2599291 RepID=UPI00131E61FD|nr:sulfotransferase [Chachezhania sediminis]
MTQTSSATIPNAIIVGAGKAGTTSLYRYLDAHPQIAGSEVKEVMYFSQRYGKGPDWYQAHFPPLPDRPEVKIRFEATPQYSFRDEFPKVAERIRDYNPEMKILYVMREPLSRIVSHFNHWSRTQPDRYRDLNATMEDPAERQIFVDRTRYHHQLQAYLDLFPADQVAPVFLEDLKRDFVPALNRVFAFLGVTESAAQIDSAPHNVMQGARNVAKVADLSTPARTAIVEALKPDVQALFAYAGKQADFWGPDYL